MRAPWRSLVVLALLSAAAPRPAAGADCAEYKIYSTHADALYLPGFVDLNLVGNPSGCQHAWSATTNVAWLSLSPASGTAPATIRISWQQNNGATRNGSVFITPEGMGTLTYTVTQDPVSPSACTSWSIAPTSASPGASAGSQAVAIAGAPSGCTGGGWTAASGAAWLGLSAASGTGPGSVTASWGANTGAARSATATIAGRTFTVTQAAPVAPPGPSVLLPSSAFRPGAGGAEFHTDVRLLNQGSAAVTISATLYDQVTGTALAAAPFPIAARNQAAFDNVLASLFGRTLANGSYGPIRFQATGPIVVSASVNNVNACGSGAVSGQWLPGIDAGQGMTAGTMGQLGVSTSGASGTRTNVVFVNPGTLPATVTARVRAGGGALLSTATIGPLAANGFSQVPLDSASVFPGVAGRTDTNLWLEFTSTQPVLAFASVIANASGDPFAVVATPDAAH